MDTRIGVWSRVRAAAICLYNFNRHAWRTDAPLAAFSIVLAVAGTAFVTYGATVLYLAMAG